MRCVPPRPAKNVPNASRGRYLLRRAWRAWTISGSPCSQLPRGTGYRVLLGQRAGRGVVRSYSSTQNLRLDSTVDIRIRFCPVSTTPLRRSRMLFTVHIRFQARSCSDIKDNRAGEEASHSVSNMDISSAPFFQMCRRKSNVCVLYTAISSAFFLRPSQSPCPCVQSLNCCYGVRLVRASVLGHATLKTPSPVLSCRAFLYSEGCVRCVAIAPYSGTISERRLLNGFLSASNSLSSSSSSGCGLHPGAPNYTSST
jgi:hypothetical protein